MFAFFSGIFQFAYSFYVYNLWSSRCSEGARYASIKPYDSTTTPTSGFQNAVRNMVVYSDPNPPGGARPAVPHLLASNVTLFVTGGGAGTLTVPMQITVSNTGFGIDAVFRTWNLGGKPNATFPYPTPP